MNKDFVLNTKKSEKIRITSYGYENLESAPCLIFVHGFKGFKDWGFWPYSGNYFAERGFFILTFNFSHNGIGENLTEFTELEKFANNTFSLELEDLNEIIQNVITDFQHSLKNKKINTNLSKLPLISLDKERIMEVMTNLIDNAIKYGGENIKIVSKIEPPIVKNTLF